MRILNIYEALDCVKGIYGEDAHITTIDSGYENIIFNVNSQFAVRFPRSQEIWNRGIVERTALGQLTDSPIAIPKILHMSDAPAYIVTEFINGKHFSSETLRNLPEHIKNNIGFSIAEFAYYLHSFVRVENIKPLLPIIKETYDQYFKRVLYDRIDPNSKINMLAKKYYDLWLAMPKAKNVVIHDDLHIENLLFDDDYKLVGVLDFGAICIGSPEQDLRQTYRLGDEFLKSAIAKYQELSGRTIDIEISKIWAITQELGAYCREDSGVAHKRAVKNLHYWLGLNL